MKINDFKGVFVPPVKSYYLGKIVYGTPYFTPWYFNSTILTIRKKKPQFLRCKFFKLFGYEIAYGWPIAFHRNDLGWKDKYDSPRFEWAPAFMIFFFNWQFTIHWGSPDGDDDRYWEMILWWKNYADKNLHKARMTWPWRDMQTERSTWNPSYVIKRKK